MAPNYVCPNCNGELLCTVNKDWTVDDDTGRLVCPSYDVFFHCSECDWNSNDHEDPIIGEIVDKNIDII